MHPLSFVPGLIPLAYASPSCTGASYPWPLSVWLDNITALDSNGHYPTSTSDNLVRITNEDTYGCKVLPSSGYCINGAAQDEIDCAVLYYSDGECSDLAGVLEFGEQEESGLVDGIGSFAFSRCEAA